MGEGLINRWNQQRDEGTSVVRSGVWGLKKKKSSHVQGGEGTSLMVYWGWGGGVSKTGSICKQMKGYGSDEIWWRGGGGGKKKVCVR